MSELLSNPELPATPEQAQQVVDEVDRITKNVKLLPGLTGIKNHSAPNKVRWHEGILFIRNPEGQRNVDDPNSINVAEVTWDNPDGSRTSFGAELTVAGMQLTKHTYPPSGSETVHETSDALAEGDYTHRDQQARIQERSLGLHIATSGEAVELIAKLQPLEPASE